MLPHHHSDQYIVPYSMGCNVNLAADKDALAAFVATNDPAYRQPTAVSRYELSARVQRGMRRVYWDEQQLPELC